MTEPLDIDEADEFAPAIGELLELTVTRHYAPVAQMLDAVNQMQYLARQGGKGTTFCGISVIVYVAFAVEAFCQTIGPLALADSWHTKRDDAGNVVKRGVERKPVEEKLKLIGRKAGVAVSYGDAPWTNIRRALQIRDEMAHPKPELIKRTTMLKLARGEHPMDYGADLVLLERERLGANDEARAAFMADVREGLGQIYEAMGAHKAAAFISGITSWTYALPTGRVIGNPIEN